MTLDPEAGVPARDAPSPWAVEVVDDERGLRNLGPLWDALLEKSGADHPFLTHEWMCAWWKAFGAGSRLRVLVVKNGGEPFAICPLMLTRTRMNGLAVRCLQAPCNSHTPRFDFLIGGNSDDAYDAVVDYLKSGRERWDVLKLCHLPASSRTLSAVSSRARAFDFLTGTWDAGASPFLDIGGDWDAYFKSLRRKHRSNLRNRFKRLEKLGQVELETLTAADGLGNALEQGFAIEAAAWKGDAGTAINACPRLRDFYGTLAEYAVRRGWLRLNFLTVGGKRVAFSYSIFYRNKFYLLKPGYDPEYARYSPVNLLCARILEQGFAAGVTEFDFLGDDDKWKMEWTRTSRQHRWLFVFSRSLRGLTLYSLKYRLIPALKRFGWVRALHSAASRGKK